MSCGGVLATPWTLNSRTVGADTCDPPAFNSPSCLVDAGLPASEDPAPETSPFVTSMCNHHSNAESCGIVRSRSMLDAPVACRHANGADRDIGQRAQGMVQDVGISDSVRAVQQVLLEVGGPPRMGGPLWLPCYMPVTWAQIRSSRTRIGTHGTEPSWRMGGIVSATSRPLAMSTVSGHGHDQGLSRAKSEPVGRPVPRSVVRHSEPTSSRSAHSILCGNSILAFGSPHGDNPHDGRFGTPGPHHWLQPSPGLDRL